MADSRDKRLRRALFLGSTLVLDCPQYRKTSQRLLQALIESDEASTDLTTRALGLADHRRHVEIKARQSGIAAGLQEMELIYGDAGLDLHLHRRDGEAIADGDVLATIEGDKSKLLALERVGLNLLQRMSGIATACHGLQNRVSTHSHARIVGTRKTPWGLLDKRALHVGGCGTHRLNLGDAILIKNNHLGLIDEREEKAAPAAVEKAWELRDKAAFIEVEVRGETAARAVGHCFQRLRNDSGEDYPCLLMLDNLSPQAASEIVKALRADGTWSDTLIEASGGISQDTVESYAKSGVDAMSIGALTHSPRALDISQQIS